MPAVRNHGSLVALLAAQDYGSGMADSTKAALLTSVVAHLDDAAMARRTHAWFDARISFLRKPTARRRLSDLLVKECTNQPDPTPLATVQDELALLRRVVGTLDTAGPLPDATLEDKRAAMIVWAHCMVRKKNFCWLRDFPTPHLAVILSVADAECEVPPEGSKAVLEMAAYAWMARWERLPSPDAPPTAPVRRGVATPLTQPGDTVRRGAVLPRPSARRRLIPAAPAKDSDDSAASGSSDSFEEGTPPRKRVRR
eukprot:TRINITY_DN25196_c0_g1_i1.p1 TRINITY_DN25196_c0_g1~~TRINITY_DN25196_c0_g1_i1.p1  ORF type:complete len:255 (+),score=66.14 TRINITY_DN25196_c0_g1_i1:108-872(+)